MNARRTGLAWSLAALVAAAIPANPGHALLCLFYGRAWQPESSPLGSFNLDVTVTPAA